MKLQKFEALEKHLLEAHPDHLSSIYLIACAKEAERTRLLAQVAEAIRVKHKAATIKRANTLQEALDFVRAPSLFGEVLIAIAEVGKDESAQLTAYARAPARGSHLIIGVENGKIANELYQLAMKEILLLDLSAETSWDKRHRLVHFAARRLGEENKKIAPASIELLVERCNLDLGLLEQEIEKLICFVGDKNEIHKEDIEAICVTSSLQMNGFQLAEKLIEGTFQPPHRIDDISALLFLIGQIRYLFEAGLRLTSQLEKGEKPVDKNLNLVRRHKTTFFQKGVLALFQLELGVKRSLGTPQLLFDRFCAQILT